MYILETKRLSISLLELCDAPFILELVNSPGWLAYIGDRHIRSTADAEHYISNGPGASYRCHGFGLYRIGLRGSSAGIGICGLVKRDHLPYPDLGYALLPEYTGQGYAQEAAAAILGHEIPVHNLATILAVTRPDNEPSVRLLHNLGFAAGEITTVTGSPHKWRLFRLDAKKYMTAISD